MALKPDIRPFHLKQFSLHHHRSSMKVGTDSLLLGLWVEPDGAQQILDIGTGCGILALLMAARTQAKIDAIELDNASFKEAFENFSHSPYSERIHAIHDDFRIFSARPAKKYDLLITNPPFFINDMRPQEQIRSRARHGDYLDYDRLCNGVAGIMTPTGRFCLVLPYDKSRTFKKIAEDYGLHVKRQLLIFPKRGWQPNRVNMELSFIPVEKTDTDMFTLREEDNKFTLQYKDFFKDYLIGLD